MTKIRLILNLSIQSVLILLLLIQSLLWPEALLYHTSLFSILISSWQILHAIYMVKKHKDWQYNRYLQIIRQLGIYVGLILGIVGLMVAITLGMLSPFWLFIADSLHIVSCGGIVCLALWYFWQSISKLYHYYHRPRSFWDL